MAACARFVPTPRTLMGPGPSDVHPRVLVAMAGIKGLMREAFQPSNNLTLPISAPGSAGMEAAFANILEPGRST